MIKATGKTHVRIVLINGNKLTSKSNLAKVAWIENCCSDYRFLSSRQFSVPYAVYLTVQDHTMFQLRWS